MSCFLLKHKAVAICLLLMTALLTHKQVYGQPANNNCGGAIAITPATTCINGTSQLTGTTVAATQSLPGCTGTADDDVWYSFVANGGQHTITVTPTAAAPRLSDVVFEVFSSSNNTCGGTFTSLICRNNTNAFNAETVNLTNLINGNTYFVRVYSNNNGGGVQGQFTICITKAAPPANDNCASATVLTPNAVCTGTAPASQASGTLVNATTSGLAAAPCTGNPDDDVWYSFTAAYTTQTITLSGIGNNIALNGTGMGGSVQVQVFSGSCGSLSSIACTNPTITSGNLITYANNLTPGNTYYVRVYSTNSISLSSNANFTICVQNPFPTSSAPTLFFGKSFRNVTKAATGGTVETGDVLEIRASVVLRQTSVLDSCAFFDNIPAGTTYVPGSLAILTNEGKVYKSFSDAAGDDEGWVSGGAVRINMGFNPYDNPATATRRGRMRNVHIPVVGGNSTLMLASYRVTVTQTPGNVISLGGGSFTYSLITASTSILTHTFNSNNVIVYQDNGICSNSVGINLLANNLSGDFDGSFGSGNTMNRIPSPNVPPGYTYTQLVGNQPGDFFYAIPNNTSNSPAGYSTVNTMPKPEPSSPTQSRIFGVFDVIGDHTNASNQLAGNPAADTTNGGTGGYMLLVNASFNIDTAFKYQISNLCPNTYYELSFWTRNICSRCGMDSVGRGASGTSVPAGYIPTAPGDSSGVWPNLSVSVDNINYYTTGDIRYTGQWIKRGFTYLTGPAQTSLQMSITNNAPGGGGNDWVLDDISVASCNPNMSYSPSTTPDYCIFNAVTIYDTVRSFYNNYTYYKWQLSTDGGTTWTDVTGPLGPATPVWNGSAWQYIASYTIPVLQTYYTNSSDRYRLVAATSTSNLVDPNCRSTDVTNNISINYINCLWPLNVKVLHFSGKLVQEKAQLSWTTSREEEAMVYEVEKSADGQSFRKIGTVNGRFPNSAEENSYVFTDPESVTGKAYYRINLIDAQNKSARSKVVLLSVSKEDFAINNLINPFAGELSFSLTSNKNTMVNIELVDQFGKTVARKTQQVTTGSTAISLNDISHLAAGYYYLKVSNKENRLSAKVFKIR